MKHSIPVIALVAAMSVAGCSNMNNTEQRTLSGAAIGAVGGGLIGAASGHAGAGALIGAGVGAVGGYVYDQNERSRGNY